MSKVSLLGDLPWRRFSVTAIQPANLLQREQLLLGSWALTMVSIPLVRWFVGDEALRWGVVISVSLLVIAVLMILHNAWGWQKLLRVVSSVVIMAWGLEWVGHTTDFPFGAYGYTAALQPQLGGVPLIIPLAWLMMLPPAWGLAATITGTARGWRFVVVSALAFTAWDLFLDPQMVAWGYWVWDVPGGYFGIPWVNFLGWFFGSALLTLIARPKSVPQGPLVVIYATTWVLQSIGQAFLWQMPGPALAGCIGMGIFLLWGHYSTRRRQKHKVMAAAVEYTADENLSSTLSGKFC